MKAAIDIGTNSLRMLVGIPAGGQISVTAQYVEETRLGENIAGKKLLPAAIRRTIQCLVDFQEILQKLSVDPPVVIATSAVRDAGNRDEFCELVRQKTGWQVDVLSGEREAYYSFAGALSVVPSSSDLPVVIDIGGGSTEVIFPSLQGVKGKSVNLGAVRLKETEYSNEELAILLEPAIAEIRDLKKCLSPVGVGGTVTTAAAVHYQITDYSREAIQGRVLSLGALEEMKEVLGRMNVAERSRVTGLPAKRGDIIVPGLRILITLLKMLGAGEITASDAGILDGLLLKS